MPSTTETTLAVFRSNQGAVIYRIPLEAFNNFWVYVYVVLLGDDIVLIDTGSGYGNSNDHLKRGLEQVSRLEGREISLATLTYVLLTHGHIDHFGGLAYVQPRTSAKIGVHELDRRTITNYEERLVFIAHRLEQYFIKAGVPRAVRENLLSTYQVNKHLFHSVPIDFTYESVGMHVGEFEMLHVPGHCPGHVVMRLHNVLFVGDHVLNRISPHMAPETITLNTGLGHYIASLESLAAWAHGDELILGGHESMVENLYMRIPAIIAHHKERLADVRAFLSTPHTIYEVSQHLFRGITGYNAILAVEEAGAHVEYLYQYGDLAIHNLSDFDDSHGPIPLYYLSIA